VQAETKIDRVPIAAIEARAYTVPTDAPESDGTIEWDSTTIVVAEARAENGRGLGYSYGHSTAATLISDTLARVVTGRNAFDVAGSQVAMVHAVRNLGRPGVASTAISAVDVALWDLKARLLDLPLVSLLGAACDGIAVYGSGGFTSYSIARLREQLAGWVAAGIRDVKMKVGRDPERDPARVAEARDAIGDAAGLYVDANGGYDRKQALRLAARFADHNVIWFEEPVSSDDLDGLRLIRNGAPSGMEIAAGEYGYDAIYFRRMLAAGAVDVLQADATRCGGVTGFMLAAALCDASGIPLSAHTAPSLHVHLCCAAPRARNLEYFHDHVRIEQMLFDGAPQPSGGVLKPDRTRPGIGLVLKRRDADCFLHH
jgi:L-alanine-DL-glutamate epimerase-like enolase superfamily enzyme